MNYYSIITNNGLINHANAASGSANLNLTELAVGDSNGSYYDPDGTENSLVNEVYRTNLTHVVVDENNPNQLIIEAVLSETVGPFYIREVGVFDSNGNLFAIGKFPETFKPNLPSGSGKRLYIRMILGFAESPNVNLIINNDIALDPNFGTDVNNALAERLIKTNNLSDLTNIRNARNNLELDLVGAVLPFATLTPPSGWIHCNGAELSRSLYSNLFSVIGVNFGNGNGTTTFNLPDLRGEFIRGLDSGRGVDVSRPLGSSQSHEWKSFHMWNNYGPSNSYSHTPVYMQKYTSDPGNVLNLFGGHWASPSGRMGLYWDGSEIRPRNIALLMCIKY